MLCIANAIEVDFYYGEGCQHCSATESILEDLGASYPLSITEREVYGNAFERSRLISEYDRFGYDISKGGVPTTIVERDTLVIGELERSQWEILFRSCLEGKCIKGIQTKDNFNETGAGNGLTDPVVRDGESELTIPVLVGAALVDSINPCTVAVMVLLLGAIMMTKGRKKTFSSGLIFSAVIFIMYMLYGLGIMKAITAFGLGPLFYSVVTLGALVLAIMEFNAFINYKPGLMAVEMPMILRPYAKQVTQNATSPLGVAVAAVLCSLFLIPCSSGPYLIVLGMLAKSTTVQTISYLILYNLIFVLPMVIITAAIFFGRTTIDKVGEVKEKYIRHIHLISGLILLLLFLIMLRELFLNML